MTANHDIRRRLARYYDTEPPLRAPTSVLQSALSTIESTPQRRGSHALRRYTNLSTYTKLAAAAVVVIAVGGFALWQVAQPGPGSQPTPAPSPSPGPTASPSPPTPGPTTYVTPALTGTFTSDRYGLSLSYPQGWGTHKATETWTGEALPLFGDPAGDFVFDAKLEDHLFLGVGSQPLAGTPLAEWLRVFLVDEGCEVTSPIVVDGQDGHIGLTCAIAIVSSGGRGYIIGIWASPDDPELRGLNTRALLEEILGTVQLHPEDALE